ncbi:hypothetical protein [Corallococcus silvisoli]|uniref:hypothetical protein n=1 Tax=Corallococcus silvisoli TaxID=2697031 RepID=UPI00137655D1|nr:hypothetical protein [Corallococcus silvisoli]NBD08269.1 hypothetical protein [Corallococcus silvisoli]
MPTKQLVPIRVWPLLLGLALIPGVARGDDSTEVHRCVVSVHRLIEDLAYESALEQVARCKQLSTGPEDDVAMLLYEGIILAEQIKNRQSDAAFRACLILDPDATLPLNVSPKLKRRFEAMRKNVRSELATRGEDREPPRREALALTQASPPPSEPLPVAVSVAPVAAPESALDASGSRASLRTRALIPAVAGGALVATAGIFWGMAEGRKAKLEGAAPDLHSRADALDVARGARGLQKVSVGLLMGGVVGLGAATGMYLLGAPEKRSSLQVGTDGTSAFVAGRWP